MKEFLCFFIISFQIAFSQKIVNFGDQKFMLKDTITIFKNENQKFILKKNLPNDTYLIKNKKDTVAIITLLNNKFTGKQTYFQKITTNKNIKYSEKYYENDLLNKEIYFNDNGFVISETNFKNNLKNGKEIIYKDTKISVINIFENDSLRNWKRYYENGSLKSEGVGGFTYRQNNLNEYQEDGTIKRIVTFKDGVPLNYILFNSNGVINEIGYIAVYEEDVKEAYSRGYNDKTKFINHNKFDKILFDKSGKKLK